MTTNNWRSDLAFVARKLEELGYPLVQTEPLVSPGRSKVRADVIGWGAVEDELRPQILVEVKSGPKPASDRDALEQLSRLSVLTGAAESYLYSGGEWYKANATFTALDNSPGPTKHPALSKPLAFPRHVAEELATQAVWRAADDHRDRSSFRDPAGLIDHAISLLPQRENLRFGSPWPLLDALTRILGRHAELGIREDVAVAMAALLDAKDGDVVLDPFCGVGGCLWGVLEKAERDGVHLQATGIDINAGTIEAATRLAELLQGEVAFRAADSLQSQFLTQADRLVTVPPWGLRLPEPLPVQMGGATRDGDVVTLDRSLSALKPGGRLVAQVARGLLFRTGDTARFRDWMAEHYAVRAVIGLPPGLSVAASIPSAFLVIDRDEPTGSTLVADLQDDWAERLASGSDIVRSLSNPGQ